MCNFIPNVYNYTPLLRQQRVHEFQPFIHHGEVRRNALPPRIPVSDFLDDGLFFLRRFAADFDVEAEVGADGEGRVNIDELQPALGFDVQAQGAVGEAGEDELVVAPDELVGPALELPPPEVGLEEGEGFAGFLGFLSGFVNMLDGVERECDVGDFLGAPVPEKEDVLLVGEELVDEVLGEFLPGLDELEDGLFR